MRYSQMSDNYATSLFQLSIETGFLPEVMRNCQDIEKVLNESPDYRNFLTNILTPAECKSDFLIELYKNKVNKLLFTMIEALIIRNEIKYFPEIVSLFLEKAGARAGIPTIRISTATKLSRRQNWRLTTTLKRLLDCNEIRFVKIIDPSLVGGILIEKNDKTIDLTVKNEFKKVAKFLNVPFQF